MRYTAIMITMLMLSSNVAFGGDAQKGKAIFAQQCASCHGASGKGDGPAAMALNPKPRDLTDKTYMTQTKDQQLVAAIKNGGAAVGKSPLMPPFGGALKEDDIQNVVAYLRALVK